VATRQRPISGTELEVLKVLWKIGPSKVRAVQSVFHDRGRKLAYTTVLTLMHRLLEKGYVKADTSQFAHVFQPSDTREEFIYNRVRDLSDQSGVAMTEILNILSRSKSKRSKSRR
jgi:predicted transcriptional regulator